MLTRHVHSRLFRVNPSLSVRCGPCADACPTGNVGRDTGGSPTWGRDCLLRPNCEPACPEPPSLRCWIHLSSRYLCGTRSGGLSMMHP